MYLKGVLSSQFRVIENFKGIEKSLPSCANSYLFPLPEDSEKATRIGLYIIKIINSSLVKCLKQILREKLS